MLQLNIEGLTSSKIDVVRQLAHKNKALVILLQETHCTDADKLIVPNYTLAGSVLNRKHGLATFVHESVSWSLIDQSPDSAEIEWVCINIDKYNIINVYKPPLVKFPPSGLPTFPSPSLYAGDFNCHHVDWGYNTSNSDGENLVEWAEINNLALLFNSKSPASFLSGRWGTGTNPDIAFTSNDHSNQLPDRRVLEKFPKTQHRPSLILAPKLVAAVPSAPVKRWNFRKADWKLYGRLTNHSAKNLTTASNADTAYQDFCSALLTAAKKAIPRGCRKNYTPCWDAECEKLHRIFLAAQPGAATNLAANNLLRRLDEKRLTRWSETVKTIDFSHTSRIAWNTLNRLTGDFPDSSNCPSLLMLLQCMVRNGFTGGLTGWEQRANMQEVVGEVAELWSIKHLRTQTSPEIYP